jgi:SAM-dependent methyltransferase
MKELIKRSLPRTASAAVRRWRIDRRQQKYGALPVSEAFDRIYDSNAWGGNEGTLNSGLGSTGRLLEAYVAMMKGVLERYGVKRLIDLGCGDFNTGKRLAEAVDSYVGVDVVRSVIDSNTANYGNSRIRFVKANLLAEPLPDGDAAVIRQVFQHLTNSEIQTALGNVLPRYGQVFITEHIYTGADSTANLDIPHGPGTRVPKRSGVFIDRGPFNMPATLIGDIEYDTDEKLRTWAVAGGKRYADTAVSGS